MKILVTGGSGTIGGYLLRGLAERGHELTCFSRTEPVENYARWQPGDIEEVDALKAACAAHEAVVHLAAVPGPGRASPERMIHVNVVGTVNVLEAAVANRIEKVVFASSGAASGFSFQSRPIVPEYLPIDEDHPSRPHDDYGLSKLLAEQACRRYTDVYEMHTPCLRINHNWYLDRPGAAVAVTGGFAKGMTVEQLWERRYRKIIREPDGEWPRPGPPRPGDLLFAVTDVRDAVQAFSLALDQAEGHDVYAINGADTCSLETSADLIDRHFPDVPLRHPFSGHQTLVSHAKATRILGYRPEYSWRDSDFSRWLASQEQALT
jgi:nucleoside-diphosphate-sugar epimerase